MVSTVCSAGEDHIYFTKKNLKISFSTKKETTNGHVQKVTQQYSGFKKVLENLLSVTKLCETIASVSVKRT